MKIGRNYIGVSAGAVIVNGDGKYFLAQRASGARDDVGTWEFPGGSVRFNETREAAAARNILEKYDLKVKIKHVLGVYDVIDKAQQDHWLSTTYVCDLIGSDIAKITYPDKCSAVGWFGIDELAKLQLSRISQLNLRDILAQGARNGTGGPHEPQLFL